MSIFAEKKLEFVALQADDPAKLAAFYCDVLGMSMLGCQGVVRLLMSLGIRR